MGEAIVYTIDEVAELLSISRSQAYRKVKDGTIPSIKLGESVRVPKLAFEEWVNKQQEKQDDD